MQKLQAGRQSTEHMVTTGYGTLALAGTREEVGVGRRRQAGRDGGRGRRRLGLGLGGLGRGHGGGARVHVPGGADAEGCAGAGVVRRHGHGRRRGGHFAARAGVEDTTTGLDNTAVKDLFPAFLRGTRGPHLPEAKRTLSNTFNNCAGVFLVKASSGLRLDSSASTRLPSARRHRVHWLQFESQISPPAVLLAPGIFGIETTAPRTAAPSQTPAGVSVATSHILPRLNPSRRPRRRRPPP